MTLSDFELSIEEREAVLRALGYYQMHLMDDIRKDQGQSGEKSSEVMKITSAIRKIHKTIGHPEPKKNPDVV